MSVELINIILFEITMTIIVSEGYQTIQNLKFSHPARRETSTRKET